MGGIGSGIGTPELGGSQGEEDRTIGVRGELGSIMEGARAGFSHKEANGQDRDVLGNCQTKVLFGKVMGH